MTTVPKREVLTCQHCSLVQFKSEKTDSCRRCKKTVVEPAPEPAPDAPKLEVVPRDASDLQIRLGKVLREMRLARNLSQRQIAAKAGFVRTYISKVENRKALPQMQSLITYAEALGVGIPELMLAVDGRCTSELALILSDPLVRDVTDALQLLTPDRRIELRRHIGVFLCPPNSRKVS